MKVRFSDTTHFTSDVVGGARDANANAVQISGAETGTSPTIAAVGDDTNVGLVLSGQGTGAVMVQGPATGFRTVTTTSTASAVTFTAAEVLGGLILRDPAGAARADKLPTAADLLAAIPDATIGTAIEFTIRNTADNAETITITTNTGLTLSGTMTIAQNNSKRFVAVFTAVDTAAVTVYSLGTVVH